VPVAILNKLLDSNVPSSDDCLRHNLSARVSPLGHDAGDFGCKSQATRTEAVGPDLGPSGAEHERQMMEPHIRIGLTSPLAALVALLLQIRLRRKARMEGQTVQRSYSLVSGLRAAMDGLGAAAVLLPR